MRANRTMVARWFHEFNAEYWGGRLNVPEFEVSNRSRRLASDIKIYGDYVRICVYNFHDRTEKEYKESLLREMCRLYVWEEYEECSCDYRFREETARIAGYGWNVRTAKKLG